MYWIRFERVERAMVLDELCEFSRHLDYCLKIWGDESTYKETRNMFNDCWKSLIRIFIWSWLRNYILLSYSRNIYNISICLLYQPIYWIWSFGIQPIFGSLLFSKELRGIWKQCQLLQHKARWIFQWLWSGLNPMFCRNVVISWWLSWLTVMKQSISEFI